MPIARTPKRVSYGTLKSKVYPIWNGEKGQGFKTVGMQFTKQEAIDLARMLLIAAHQAQNNIDLCGFRHANQVTVTSALNQSNRRRTLRAVQ
jgi:hypothetical protein